MHVLKISKQYVEMMIDILKRTDNNSLPHWKKNLPDRVACLTESITSLKSNFG